MTGRRDVDEFLDRSESMLTEPEPPAACAWCSHPLDDASPSGEFCGEHCAHNWRTGLDWFPEERCACRACDPDGAHHRPRTDPLRTAWIDVSTWQAEAPYYIGARPVTTEFAAFRDALRGVMAAVTTTTVDWRDPELPTAEVTTEYFRDLSHDLPPAPYPRWLADRVTEPGPTFVTPFNEVVTYETGERSP